MPDVLTLNAQQTTTYYAWESRAGRDRIVYLCLLDNMLGKYSSCFYYAGGCGGGALHGEPFPQTFKAYAWMVSNRIRICQFTFFSPS